MPLIEFNIEELSSMKSYPKRLSYSGDLKLLQRKKVSIIGSRKPSKYSRNLTQQLATQLSNAGICIVSGGAMGIDAIAHISAKAKNTISVLPCGINIKYPAINKNLLSDIETNGLLISQFDDSFKATPWSFVVRNEVVVALGDILIVAEAQLKSGSVRSIEFAKKMGKDIYVFPHQIGDSEATNELLKNSQAKAIYNIEEFVNTIAPDSKIEKSDDSFIEFCKTNPTYEESLNKYPNRVFEAELSGDIKIQNGKVYII